VTVADTYLAEVTAFDPGLGAEVVLRFSTGVGFITGAGDTPAHTLYEPRLEQAVRVARTIFAPGTTYGRSRVAYGELVLLNLDGVLDGLLDYAFDGRVLTVWRGPSGATTLSAFVRVFVGTMEQVEFKDDRVVFTLRDGQAPLMLPVQSSKYGGTNVLPNGLDGVAGDLGGKPKPLLYGTALNVQPPMVNTSRLVYHVHDGALASLDAVYDRGVALTDGGTYADAVALLDDAQAPSAGTFKVWLAGGMFRLGSRPTGTVTADATQGATAADRTASALYEAILLRMGVTAGAIRATDLTALTAANSALLGVWINTETKAADLLDRIATSVGAWWGVDALGQYRIALLERPFATPVFTFTANDLHSAPIRVSTADIERGLPAYRVTTRYAQAHTVQTDLALGVDDARRAVVSEEWREVTLAYADVQTVHLLAVALSYETLLVVRADAEAFAARVLNLRSVQRHRFELEAVLNDETALLDLGDVVGLLHPRYGLTIDGDTAGQAFVVIGIEPDARHSRLRLTLWGNSFTTRNLIASTGDNLVTSSGDYLVTSSL